MNWLGAGLPSIIAAIVATILGALVRFWVSRLGYDLPPLVGIIAGAVTALSALERSGHRGLLVASLAVWAAALGEVLVRPAHGIVSDLLHFSDRMTLSRLAAYVVCLLAALYLGSRAARPATFLRAADSRRAR